MISDETIQAVRERTNIRQVVGERVKLEQRGNRLIGLCPFHKEKSPSFNVNEERGFYYCFGCHASGDAIKFVQETEGLAFLEAIRELAERSGIDIVETRSEGDRQRYDEARRQRDDLLGASRAAAEYFERCLVKHPLSTLARDELQRRGLLTHSDEGLPSSGAVFEALSAFRVGYAPYGWDGLAEALRGAGFSPQTGETLGLLAPRKTGAGHYDRFRHRLMFAVLDLRGDVVGFSGRALPEPSPEQLARSHVQSMGSSGEEPAKYINSPESPLYKKREVVFGLFQARAAVRNQNECILVEGNFDVVSLHARGVLNVVAPLGTAFTQEQAAQIKRYSSSLLLMFDGDKAGRRAIIASKEPADAEGLSAKVATLPEGVDPDDLARTKGVEAIRQCVRSAKGMLEYRIQTALDSGFRAADPEIQGQKIQEVLELIRAETDPTVRALARSFADSIAARLGISDVRSLQALQRAVKDASGGQTDQASPSPRDRAIRELPAQPPERARSTKRHGALDENILGALLEHPALAQDEQVQELLAFVSGPLALALATVARAGQQVTQVLEQLPEHLARLVAQRLARPELADLEQAKEVLLSDLNKLRRRQLRAAGADTQDQMRAAQGDIETQEALLRELQERLRIRRT
ncbi:MAG: hypothetical protein RJA70_411 [Pseudomonadota bacterium]|jgi:DNA primase